ncbi:MAG: hypothetical protein K6A89_09315 [Treponema sp.]|nr:hypothetical protein [Treponema sp.]
MKFRKYCFISIIFLYISGNFFAQSSEEVQRLIPAWTANIDEVTDNYVYQCVGNEDNSLFLLNVVIKEGWHNVIYAFSPNPYGRDSRIKAVWDQAVCGGDVRSLVFSPFSKKFYFMASWEHPLDFEAKNHGLWIATQTHKDYEPVLLSHQAMQTGLGFLIVNKSGVWLLYDESHWDIEDGWMTSVLYQVEDDHGRFIFQIPESVNNFKEYTFHSYWSFENPVRREIKDEYIKYEYQINFRNTDYALIIRDKDETSWWVFNCVTEECTKYESFEMALKKAERIDQDYDNELESEGNKKSPLFIFFYFFPIICVLVSVTLVIILFTQKKKLSAKKEASLIEHNKMIFDIQEKERAKISRDIHDSVVQDIRVLRLETENLAVDEASKQRQSKIEDIATDCIIKLRNICYNLTPAELASHNQGDSSKFELISIINSLVQQFTSRTHIPCVFKVDEGFEYPVLEKEETQNLFRVIQEALTNIEKHSYATQTSIFIKKDIIQPDKNFLLIYITDDGIGCNPDELDKKLKSKEHLGLRSMIDRMELIGGSIEFFTSQNDGMEIKIRLPLENVE